MPIFGPIIRKHMHSNCCVYAFGGIYTTPRNLAPVGGIYTAPYLTAAYVQELILFDDT